MCRLVRLSHRPLPFCPRRPQRLLAGDDIRARFILEAMASRLSPATGATTASDVATLSPATAALADGDDIRARFILDDDIRSCGLAIQP